MTDDDIRALLADVAARMAGAGKGAHLKMNEPSADEERKERG